MKTLSPSREYHNLYHIEEYKIVNSIFKEDTNFEFMNHGYHPIDDSLIDSSILFKNCATLYLHVISKLNLDSVKSILEVGCGRGGGMSLIRDMYNIKDICGCDITQENIDYCIKNHKNIEFKVQDACDLNYDKKFDVILNIESSHCYADIKKFFQKVVKFLKNDGFFLYVDIFSAENINSVKDTLLKNFFILEEEDITENVYLSCKNSIKILEQNLKMKENNFDACNLMLDVFKEKEITYKYKNNIFYIFVCKPNRIAKVYDYFR